jgi:hypothetical protein
MKTAAISEAYWAFICWISRAHRWSFNGALELYYSDLVVSVGLVPRDTHLISLCLNLGILFECSALRLIEDHSSSLLLISSFSWTGSLSWSLECKTFWSTWEQSWRSHPVYFQRFIITKRTLRLFQTRLILQKFSVLAPLKCLVSGVPSKFQDWGF